MWWEEEWRTSAEGWTRRWQEWEGETSECRGWDRKVIRDTWMDTEAGAGESVETLGARELRSKLKATFSPTVKSCGELIPANISEDSLKVCQLLRGMKSLKCSFSSSGIVLIVWLRRFLKKIQNQRDNYNWKEGDLRFRNQSCWCVSCQNIWWDTGEQCTQTLERCIIVIRMRTLVKWKI